jgi:uncharacterized protein involved in exopolysaccharide biosynthesis
MMEEEIDLRVYIDSVLCYWKWIIACVLVAAVAAFIVSSLRPDVYEASSIVMVTEPRYNIRFDPRFQTAQELEPASEAFQTLATSDGLLQGVIEKYVPSVEAGIDRWRLPVLAGMVTADSGGDPSLLILSVRSHSPQDAAAIANVWADIVVRTGDMIYGESEADVAFFEEQVSQAAQKLSSSDAALIEFEARNQISILTAQLDSWQQAQVDYLGDKRLVSYLVQDIQGLREQLAQREEDEPLSVADDLSALLLQIMAFNAQVAAPNTQTTTSAPIALQIDTSESLSDKSPAQQMAVLEDLESTLLAKSAKIDARLLELEPQILDLQRRLQEANAEYDRLTRTSELAGETYLTLARKLDEARIAAQEEGGTFRVASYAAVPEQPVAPRTLFNTVVAGVLGLIVGAFCAVGIEFWRQFRGQEQEAEE